MEAVQTLETPPPHIPVTFVAEDTEAAQEIQQETEAETDFEIPEPDDLPSFEHKSEAELEEEIVELSQDHLRSLDEIGPRIYWLNQKYKTRKKRKGEGVKAFCQRIGWDSESDMNHWNYLVRKYEPEDKKAERLVKKAARHPKQVNPPNEVADEVSATSEPEQASGEPAQKNEISINTFEDVRALVKKCLIALSPSKQIKELQELKEWIVGQLEDLKEEYQPKQAA